MSRKDEQSDTSNVPAITYTTNSAEEIVQPRPPRNFQDLLRYSTEASNLLGGPRQTDSISSLDEESKKFLEGALKSMTIDIVEELMKSINILQNAGTLQEDDDPTDCEEALDHIFEFVDNLDVANDFHKIGGFNVFNPCLQSVHGSLRWRGAELIAELCQNNPYCQEKVLETGLMSNLLKMVDNDVENIVRIKALHAVSCLVRDCENGLNEFLNNDGFSVLLRSLQTDIEKLNIKAAFLLTSICHWKPEVKDDIVNMGYIEQLISQLSVHIQMFNERHPPVLEHLLNAILDIVRSHKQAQEIARTPELQFKNLLKYILKNSENNDQYDEENMFARSLIQIVFGESESTEEDR